VTLVSRSILPPVGSTCSEHRCPIMPGPYLGYRNLSMRLVVSGRSRRGRNALRRARESDRRFHSDHEEVELCRRARLAGWRVALLLDLGIHHQGGSGATKRHDAPPSQGVGNR